MQGYNSRNSNLSRPPTSLFLSQGFFTSWQIFKGTDNGGKEREQKTNRVLEKKPPFAKPKEIFAHLALPEKEGGISISPPSLLFIGRDLFRPLKWEWVLSPNLLSLLMGSSPNPKPSLLPPFFWAGAPLQMGPICFLLSPSSPDTSILSLLSTKDLPNLKAKFNKNVDIF